MNYLMKNFERENAFLNGKYSDYRKPLEILTTILDGHGHSGSSIGYVTSALRDYRELRFKELTASENLVFKVDVNFKDLFDQLDEWYFNPTHADEIEPTNNSPLLILVEKSGPPIDFFTLLDLFSSLSKREPLSPLTGDDDEWFDRSDGTDLQNKRLGSVFKNRETGKAHWLDGHVLVEFYDDFSGHGTYHSNRVPRCEVSFPFDTSTAERIYYVIDPLDPTETDIKYIGTWDVIKPHLEELRRTHRRNWMLGFEPDGVTLRKEVLLPIDREELWNAVSHFRDNITEVLDIEYFDLYDMENVHRTLFEGSVIHLFGGKVSTMLYRAAVLYSELPKDERRKIFHVKYVEEALCVPSQHFQSYVPLNASGTVEDVYREVKRIVYLSSNNTIVPENRARKYLFEECKKLELEFKPGKKGEITSPIRDNAMSVWFTPLLSPEGDGWTEVGALVLKQ